MLRLQSFIETTLSRVEDALSFAGASLIVVDMLLRTTQRTGRVFDKPILGDGEAVSL